jgi:hypothetical protein
MESRRSSEMAVYQRCSREPPERHVCSGRHDGGLYSGSRASGLVVELRVLRLRNGASLYVPGSSRIRADFPGASLDPDCQSRPEDLRVLQDPRWGDLFDHGFHCDRGGTVPLAMLTVLLQAKIALTFVQPAASTDKIVHLRK